MKFKKVLSEAIDNNSKIIITGKSGWGKSEMIQQVAEEKELELVDFRLSEVLPEDIVGIPKVKDEYYEYVPPLWLYNILQHPEKKYLLFLDEITQGTPEVLNICYKIFDKQTKIGDHLLPNVAVVGATNYKEESNYLSELPEPLKRRACMLELDHDSMESAQYLQNKHNLSNDVETTDILSAIINKSNPRSVDKAIELIKNDCCKELVIPYVGLENYKLLGSMVTLSGSDIDDVSDINKVLKDINSGYMEYKGEKYALLDKEMFEYAYNLCDEEIEVINSIWTNKKISVGDDLRRDFFTQYAIIEDLQDFELLKTFKNYRSFNPVSYIQKVKIVDKTFDSMFSTLQSVLGLTPRELAEIFCKERTLPLCIMKRYREYLPWGLLSMQAQKGWLSESKIKEFRKELTSHGYQA